MALSNVGAAGAVVMPLANLYHDDPYVYLELTMKQWPYSQLVSSDQGF